MEHLTDFTITKVFEPKKDGEYIEGTGEYGDWKLYNFYTDKTDKQKFSYMWGEKKPRPEQGLKIKHMEYEKETKGQYTNLNAKKLELASQPESTSAENSPPTTSQPQPINDSDEKVSYFVSYMTKVAIAIIENGGNLETADLDIIAKRIGKAGSIMMNESLGTINIPSESHNTPKETNKPTNPTPLSPENEKLKKQLQVYAKMNKEKYFKVLGQHGAEKGEDIYRFAVAAQVSLLNDLEKELGDIPF